MDELGDFTRAVHAGDGVECGEGGLDGPVVFSNAFRFEDAADAAERSMDVDRGPIYGRWGNPTVRLFEEKMAALEGAEDAVALASGMGAISGTLASLLGAGAHVVAPRGVYAEVPRILRGPFARFGVEADFVDTTDVEQVARAIRKETRVVWIETPANPTLAISDIRAVAEVAHGADAKLVVDSTFATPFHQRPLSLGADLVVHSATKAIGGHGDAIGGVVLGSRALVGAVRQEAVRGAGCMLSPFTAWVLTRGVRTLPLRATRTAESALELARRLEADPRIAWVRYPGLTSHPQHELAAKQMRNGGGSLLAFEVAGGLEAARRTYDALELVVRAVSLGDVRSLITHPASTTHLSMSPLARAEAGIGEGLMRLSVGIEDVEDLHRDLDRALRRAG